MSCIVQVGLSLRPCWRSPRAAAGTPPRLTRPSTRRDHSDIAAVNQSFQSPAFEAYAVSVGRDQRDRGRRGGDGGPGRTQRGAAGRRQGPSALRYAHRTHPPFFSRTAAADIPPEYLGVTFVWTSRPTATSPGRPGAPDNGVRFVLYAVNPITGRPVEPLVRDGYADIPSHRDQHLVHLPDRGGLGRHHLPRLRRARHRLRLLDRRRGLGLRDRRRPIGRTSTSTTTSPGTSRRSAHARLRAWSCHQRRCSDRSRDQHLRHRRRHGRRARSICSRGPTRDRDHRRHPDRRQRQLDVAGHGDLFATITVSGSGATQYHRGQRPAPDRGRSGRAGGCVRRCSAAGSTSSRT